jgi:hypothetical protein
MKITLGQLEDILLLVDGEFNEDWAIIDEPQFVFPVLYACAKTGFVDVSDMILSCDGGRVLSILLTDLLTINEFDDVKFALDHIDSQYFTAEKKWRCTHVLRTWLVRNRAHGKNPGPEYSLLNCF